MLRPMPDDASPIGGKRAASLFRNGRNQALRIPREYEFQGKTVLMYKDGDRLIIEPMERKPTLLEVLAALKPIDEPIEIADDPPPEPVDL